MHRLPGGRQIRLFPPFSKFPDYGKLAHLNLDRTPPDGPDQNDEYEKERRGRLCAVESVGRK